MYKKKNGNKLCLDGQKNKVSRCMKKYHTKSQSRATDWDQNTVHYIQTCLLQSQFKHTSSPLHVLTPLPPPPNTTKHTATKWSNYKYINKSNKAKHGHKSHYACSQYKYSVNNNLRLNNVL